MNSHWQDLASNSNGYYEEDDFAAATYRLVTDQVIYHSDLKGRKIYSIIDQYERHIAKALAPLGVTIGVDRQLLYAYALPQHPSLTTATIPQTMFALVLRGLYEDGMRAGQVSDDSGEIICDFIELQEKYRLMTNRELPPKGELETLIRTARRWGIVRRLEAGDTHLSGLNIESDDGGIAIRPAIRVILGEAALQQLALWGAKDRDVELPPAEDSDAQQPSPDDIP
ncbi:MULTISPECIES: DUF4194 domain-containing protein [Pseudomonas]|jgi:hypothetical protein|uniref:DUF4194 domain-containing protein n=1 Tax=Pseudomonas mosselii TaxID=78327 RepID=A0A5R8ZGN1_9PSED|nr:MULTISPECIES: DUF4194 domain-containing protein [Pseudomonas]EKT4459899.1 DUF4194 domain-containing protein [Pseudomonas putida]MBX8589292.1 DUF4194 domain-containing protein [Pseudomonas cichorii]MBK5003756.1 DUF4194 domain-containing protein [Pseudomonas sp. S32]MBX8596370.1 DUF4194 domain-containing protein [Pseudomonas cichorii]MBX8615568.1 DUF4194 domain-containing protein [Pseudomonas cichorii]